jgi:hypothetical protein
MKWLNEVASNNVQDNLCAGLGEDLNNSCIKFCQKAHASTGTPTRNPYTNALYYILYYTKK